METVRATQSWQSAAVAREGTAASVRVRAPRHRPEMGLRLVTRISGYF
jgi:hypothetical protein